jgi:hypothetical protein
VQGDRELAGAQIRSEVAADLADGVDHQLADLLGEMLELIVAQSLEVTRAVDPVKQLLELVRRPVSVALLFGHDCLV